MPDSVVISLAAKSMEGVDAADPKVTVDIMETTPISRRVSRQIVSNFNGQVTLNVPMPDGLPAPSVDARTLSVLLTPPIVRPRGDEPT